MGSIIPKRCNSASTKLLLTAYSLLLVVGCAQSGKDFVHFNSPVESAPHSDFSEDVSYEVCYSANGTTTEAPSHLSPPTVTDFEQLEKTPLTVDDAISMALSNSNLIRETPQIGGQSAMMRSPNQATTVMDVALQESGYLFGQRGVQAALSDFDTSFETGMFWGRDERIQNNRFLSGGVIPGDTLTDESAIASAQLSKSTRNGGSVSLRHEWAYNGTNRTDVLFPSAYDGTLEFQYRQPLLAGAGRDVVDVAGPRASNLRGVSEVSQGIVIAQINTAISILDFEIAMSDLLRNVEIQYWQLYSAQKKLTQLEDTRSKLSAIASITKNRVANNGLGFGAVEASEIGQAMLENQIQLNRQKNLVLSADAQLRRLMSLPVSSHEIYECVEAPSAANIQFDWNTLVQTATEQRPELRRQELEVRKLRKQLAAAMNLALPTLDFVSSYQINGFGDDLFSNRAANFSSAYGTLFDGQQEGWGLGFQFTRNLCNRLELTRIRNLRFQLAKACAIQREQQTEVVAELVQAYRELENQNDEYQLTQRLVGQANENLNATVARFNVQGDNQSLLAWLNAEQSYAAVEDAQMNTQLQRQVAIANLHYNAGSTLDLNQMTISGDHCQVVWKRRKTTLQPLGLPEESTASRPIRRLKGI